MEDITMKHFGALLLSGALAIVGATYYIVHSNSCTTHRCFEGQHAKLGRGLAGYACTCVTDR